MALKVPALAHPGGGAASRPAHKREIGKSEPDIDHYVPNRAAALGFVLFSNKGNEATYWVRWSQNENSWLAKNKSRPTAATH